MVFKSLNGLVPEYLTSKFIKRNESNYSLRDSVNKLVVPFPRTNYMKNSFSQSVILEFRQKPNTGKLHKRDMQKSHQCHKVHRGHSQIPHQRKLQNCQSMLFHVWITVTVSVMVFLNKNLTNLKEFKALQHVLLLELNNMNTSHLLFVSYSDCQLNHVKYSMLFSLLSRFLTDFLRAIPEQSIDKSMTIGKSDLIDIDCIDQSVEIDDTLVFSINLS